MSLTNLQYSCGYKERPDEKNGGAAAMKSPKAGGDVRTSSQLSKNSNCKPNALCIKNKVHDDALVDEVER